MKPACERVGLVLMFVLAAYLDAGATTCVAKQIERTHPHSFFLVVLRLFALCCLAGPGDLDNNCQVKGLDLFWCGCSCAPRVA
jgi:hypothetical protein